MESIGHLGIRGVGALALVAGATWYVVLMRPIVAAAAYGPICRHGGLLALHCPACYAALALAGLGLAALVAAPSAPAARVLIGASFTSRGPRP